MILGINFLAQLLSLAYNFIYCIVNLLDETAKSMKSEDIPVNTIARFTGLSPEEIEKL